MLQDSKIQQDVELNVVRSKSHEAEGRSSELEMKLVGLQELIVTLKDGKGAEKVSYKYCFPVSDLCTLLFQALVYCLLQFIW